MSTVRNLDAIKGFLEVTKNLRYGFFELVSKKNRYEGERLKSMLDCNVKYIEMIWFEIANKYYKERLNNHAPTIMTREQQEEIYDIYKGDANSVGFFVLLTAR